MFRKFVTYGFFFFLPVVVGYLTVEWLTINLPSQYPYLQKQLENRSESFEVLILGSSQMMSGINAEWMDIPTLNLSSGTQHHDTDFRIFQEVAPRLPKLKMVVLEVSYSHFELPHNGIDFWKNSLYLKYYNANCFDRYTYFKDKLLYVSNPKVFSERIVDYYVDDKNPYAYNSIGYNFEDTYGQFAAMNFNVDSINAMVNFKINLRPNTDIFYPNVAYFNEMLDFLTANNYQVILCTAPMYTTYLERRNPDILRRRDSTLAAVSEKYKNVFVLDMEESGAQYELSDFWNQSHLSPNGAKKFTGALNRFLSELP